MTAKTNSVSLLIILHNFIDLLAQNDITIIRRPKLFINPSITTMHLNIRWENYNESKAYNGSIFN